jgi:cytochrome c oxidase subunit IV
MDRQITAFRILALLFALPAPTLAGDFGKETVNISWNLFFIIISAIIGYIVGTMKSFREEKQKAYGEIIPPIAKLAYHPQNTVDEKEYSKAVFKLWLFGSKKVASRVEEALQIIHDPKRGNEKTRALQEAIAEMRKDTQIWSWQQVKPEDVKHIYTVIVGAEAKPKNDNT